MNVSCLPTPLLSGKYLNAARKEMLIHTDARVKLSSEIVTGEMSDASSHPLTSAHLRNVPNPPFIHPSCRSLPCPGIKAIKLYAWESAYVSRIGQLREMELHQIRRTQLLSALNTAVFQVAGIQSRDGVQGRE